MTWHGFDTDVDVQPIKAKRKRISTQQLNRLMAIFQQTDTPSSEVREQLANELDMTKREVQVWFQNRRAKASRARAAAAQAAAQVAMTNANFGYPANIMPMPPSQQRWSDPSGAYMSLPRRSSSFIPNEHNHPPPIPPVANLSQPPFPHVKPIAPRRDTIHQGLQNLSLHSPVPPKRRPHSAYVFNNSYDFSRPPPMN
ncbi:homeobox-domain-containing protein [Hesseltinella vesiculosa]|uniref:Homeobox-domain-containing protein n=1 Tax=Hesseltinella vesiculosa TaxID=101127 RepID=A0A1X2GW85_9FUNG|nr:homeobox-domain-containing protein [Hesseltinella vesiculosa]